MKTCCRCGTKDFEFLYYMEWYNGADWIKRYYCPKCVKSGDSPPLKQVRKIGTVRKVYKEDMLD